MAFRLQDLCKTTRRAAGNGLPRLFPRVLGDDRLDPRLGIAIRFFETHLGQPRGELDAEALMTLFGDPRLARGLIHCLARSYRYRDRPLADILGTERAAALTARGLGTPRDLRALAYRRANQAGGFVSPAHRADFLVHLVDDLEPTELEQVLWLDAADQAVLVRAGSIPTAADIRACYNVQVLETLLSTAPESRFALRGNPACVEAVAARHGVQARVEGATVTLYGRPDAVGVDTTRRTRGTGSPDPSDQWNTRLWHSDGPTGRTAVRSTARYGPAGQGIAAILLGGSSINMGSSRYGRACHPDPATAWTVSRVAPALVARATGRCAGAPVARTRSAP